ncbi:hypothetical protein OROGR_013441 [Orobanche gracilis]
MTVCDAAFVDTELSKKTSIFGLHLWIVIGIFVGAAVIVLVLSSSSYLSASPPPAAAEAARVKLKSTVPRRSPACRSSLPSFEGDRPRLFLGGGCRSLSDRTSEVVPEIQIDMGKVEHRVVFSDRGASRGESRATSGAETSSFGGSGSLPEVSHLGWGRWYSLRELEAASNGLSDDNVIGEGGYVYGGQAEKEFKAEVEVIGRVRHKNLVRLLGYYVEGAYRMLVYEYVDNGNLDQWLHGDVGDVSPLTWEIRMNIIIGIAKGLSYLHEGLEPKVVHRDIKSSNILLDRQWHNKLSDFGLAKLLNSESSYVTTRVMGTFGYVAPEYASTGMLNEKSDIIYSFGILIMEIITGRSPVDYNRPKGEISFKIGFGKWDRTVLIDLRGFGPRQTHPIPSQTEPFSFGESERTILDLWSYTGLGLGPNRTIFERFVNLVDWLKMMVGNRKSEEVIDPKLPERPASKALKHVILVALRCVDPDAQKRPKMDHIIHMLESDLLSRDVCPKIYSLWLPIFRVVPMGGQLGRPPRASDFIGPQFYV